MAKKKHIKPTNKANVFHAAKMLVAFQKRPGVAADRLITNAGSGIFTKDGGQPIVINPVKGLYAIPLQTGETGHFELFDTVYTVASISSGDDKPFARPSIVNWPLPLSPANTLIGVQQRLQILGYYTSVVDGVMGNATERAVLEFQADEGTLLIDGDPGPKTKTALDTYFAKNGLDGSGLPIIRKYLISFQRFASGHASWNSPHPDIRGGDTPVVSYFVLKGVVSWLLNFLGIKDSEQAFKVKMKRENFVPRAKNTYCSIEQKGTSVLSIDAASVVSTPSAIPPIKCVASDSGNAKIQVHFGAAGGPVIGEMNVRIVPLLQVRIFIHILDIKNSLGIAVPNKWTLQKAEQLISDINAIWAPAGVEFKVNGSKSYGTIGEFAGTVTITFDSITDNIKKDESDILWKNNNINKCINIYFSNQILWQHTDAAGNATKKNYDIMGFACSRKDAGPTGPIGVCVKYDNDMAQLARTIAHELGHVLDLTLHPHGHADDDGTDDPFRNDIWSRIRLMSKYVNHFNDSPNRLWQDTDYGKNGHNMNGGALITIKQLKNDGTDNEFNVARKSVDKGPY